MRAAILSIGDELVSGLTVDTNSGWLAGRLGARGIEVGEVAAVPDDRQPIAAAVRRLAETFDLLFITGGLGPTLDDLTREALGDVLTPGEPLESDADALERIEAWFSHSGRAMPPSNRKQATRPPTATFIPNHHGTAPGLLATTGHCRIISLPGVPHEMKAMFETIANDVLGPPGGEIIATRAIHTIGIGESDLAERLGDLLSLRGPIRIGTTSARAMVSVRLYARGGTSEVADILDHFAAEIEERAYPYAFGRDACTIAHALGGLLRERSLTIATAESCTGGLLGAMLTHSPGASDFYLGGWITYSDDLKSRCVGVDDRLIADEGAVSGPVARAMAEGAMAESGADLALSITGIAGPGGAQPEKPIGTVFIACAHRTARGDVATKVRQFLFRGDRRAIRERSAKTALQIVRFHLLDVSEHAPLLGEVEVAGGAVPTGQDLNRAGNE